MNPDEWATRRIYPPTSGWPGPRDARITPYMIPWARMVADATYSVSCMVCGAQMGKTDTQLDIMGERLDNRPTPIIYVGPNKEFNEQQFEPRLVEMLSQAKSLGRKQSRKRSKKTLKRIAGVRLRLAHAGSSTALKSDPAGLAFVDEYDDMLTDVKKQGDPMGLLGARGYTYSDFHRAVASTCSRGIVECEMDEASGLEMWKEAPVEDLESAIWRLFQTGTMHHWAWPCPHCDEYFVPYMKLMKWPDGASASRAKREAWMECPHCKTAIYDEAEGDDQGKTKAWMNERGVMVARGQWITRGNWRDGSRTAIVEGEPKDTETVSYWVSGLASPFVTWGERVHDLVQAEGDPKLMQTAVNAGFGELYSPGGGDVPEWREILNLRRDYEGVPRQARLLTAGVDVQKRGLYYTVRAWGAKATSWKVAHGYLFGDTTQPEVWTALHDVLTAEYDGRLIKVAFIDSGFRPGKPDLVPENKVYEFCRLHSRFVFPTKGHDTQAVPIRGSKIEVKATGGVQKFGLELKHLDSDFFKSWVHERIRYPVDRPGAMFFDLATTDENYARQIVSEARLKVDGKPTWVRKSRDNHYLDTEALCAAAGYLLNVHRYEEPKDGDGAPAAQETAAIAAATNQTTPPAGAPAPAQNLLVGEGDTQLSKFAKMAAMMNKR